MTFEWPLLLVGLLLVPLAVLLYVFAQRRRARYAVRFTNLDLLANVVDRTPGWRRHIPPALQLLALAALVVALARPHAVIMVPRDQATVVLVMDVSRSMEAVDVQPTRLGAAQDSALRFVSMLPRNVRVGVVSFSIAVSEIAAPTTDRTKVERAIKALQPDSGTAMGDGLAAGLASGLRDTAAQTDANGGQSPIAIVLLSDGASGAGRLTPQRAAQQAAQAHVPVYTISLGTASGVVTVAVPGGRPQIIPVPPDPDTLRQVASITGGQFFAAPSESDLRSIYEELSHRIGFTPEEQEITALFAAAALALMAAGSGLALLWFNRFP